MNVAELAEAKGFRPEELIQYGLRDEQNVKDNPSVVCMPIYDADGTEYRLGYRVSAEDGKGFFYDNQKEKPNIPYGINHPVPIKKVVYIVEGQSDCWAMWTAGIPAIGIPGATSTNTLFLSHVEPAELVVVIQEPDDAGARFPYRVAQRLWDQGYEGEVCSIQLPGFKDPREAFQADRNNFKSVLNAAWKTRAAILRDKVATSQEDDLGLMTYEELVKVGSGTTDWIVEGLLRASGLLLLAGRPKVGKSFIGRNLARSVASGGDFLGRRCKQGTVVWVGLEETTADLVEALEMMGATQLPILYRVTPFHKDQNEWLRRMIERVKPSLVIVDTIGKFADIEEINSYSQAMKATKPFMDYRNKYGTTFCLLHHTGNNNKVLGSTYWEGAVDHTAIMTRNEDGTRFIQTVGQRGLTAIGFEQAALKWDQETGIITGIESKEIADRRTAEDNILDAASDGCSRTREQFSLLCGRRSAIGRGAFDSLVSRGDIVFVRGEGTRTDPRLYALRTGYEKPEPTGEPGEPGESEESKQLEAVISIQEADDILAHAQELGL